MKCKCGDTKEKNLKFCRNCSIGFNSKFCLLANCNYPTRSDWFCKHHRQNNNKTYERSRK